MKKKNYYTTFYTAATFTCPKTYISESEQLSVPCQCFVQFDSVELILITLVLYDPQDPHLW